MSFERPTPEQAPEVEHAEADVENILEGRGLEEIAKVGWGKYREVLTRSSYADIIERQARQIDEIKLEAGEKTAPLPGWVVHGKNVAASDRARNLSAWLRAEYSRDKSASFYSDQDRGKKLITQGREEIMDERDRPLDGRLTRIYFTVPTGSSPEAYKALFDSFVDEGVMGRVQLALNLENFQADSLDRTFENNTIIAYVYGDSPPVMTKIAKAITRAKKESSPELWALAPKDLAKAKESMVRDFMVPLDDTTAFVEAKDINSYHSGSRGRMFQAITGEIPYRTNITLEGIAAKFKTWTPDRPGLLEDNPERRRFMPALVWD